MTPPPRLRPVRKALNFLHSGADEPLNETFLLVHDSSKSSETSNRSGSLPLDGATVGIESGRVSSHRYSTVEFSKLCRYHMSRNLWSPSSNEGERRIPTRQSTSA